MAVKPSIYIPTLYLAEGLPYTIVNMMSVVYYKNLGASNEFIGLYTSLFYIPWIAKFLWAPLVDLYSTRRHWLVVSQLALSILIACLAASTLLKEAILISLIVFVLIALASSTQDIAIDGFYMDVLTREKQAFYVGVRNAAYKVSWLLGSGGLVFLAGKLAESENIGIRGGWTAAYLICALMLFAAFIFHQNFLPILHNQNNSAESRNNASHCFVPNKARANEGMSAFAKVFLTFFDQPRIWIILLYVLSFRLGDALMLKMAQPFLLDNLEKGGLAISTADVGLIYGTVGIIFLIAGGIVGGAIVAKFGLKSTLFPTALIQNSAILLYWALSVYKPSITWVCATNAVEQFAYGLGTAAYTVFLLTIVKQEYKAAHYAMATAFMACGLMLPGAISGFLTEWLGYQKFFLISFLVSLPGIITILFLPIKENAHALQKA